MPELLIGMCTFGNLQFTKLTVESILNTVSTPFEMFFVVGKPGDTETINWLENELRVSYILHNENYGFPFAINDIYDFWKERNYPYLIIVGNDIYAYPYAIDSSVG